MRPPPQAAEARGEPPDITPPEGLKSRNVLTPAALIAAPHFVVAHVHEAQLRMPSSRSPRRRRADLSVRSRSACSAFPSPRARAPLPLPQTTPHPPIPSAHPF